MGKRRQNAKCILHFGRKTVFLEEGQRKTKTGVPDNQAVPILWFPGRNSVPGRNGAIPPHSPWRAEAAEPGAQATTARRGGLHHAAERAETRQGAGLKNGGIGQNGTSPQSGRRVL